MFDFICMALFELQRTHSKQEKQKKNSCSQWDSIPVSSTNEADALPITHNDNDNDNNEIMTRNLIFTFD